MTARCQQKLSGKGLAAFYRQELIQDVSLFTSQSVVKFYDKLFSVLDFELPRADTGRRGFPKEAMLCAFIVMKSEGFTQITDLADYLENNLEVSIQGSACISSSTRSRHTVTFLAPRRSKLRTAQKNQSLDAAGFSSTALRCSSFSPRDLLRWTRTGPYFGDAVTLLATKRKTCHGSGGTFALLQERTFLT